VKQHVSRLAGFLSGILAAYFLHAEFGGRYYTTEHGWRHDGMTGEQSRGAGRVLFAQALDEPFLPKSAPSQASVAPDPPVPTAPPTEEPTFQQIYEQRATESHKRAIARYPQFKDQNSEARKALNTHVSAALNDQRRKAFFAEPDWPERLVAEFVSIEHRRPSEPLAPARTQVSPPVANREPNDLLLSESWERVFAGNPALKDAKSEYRKHFQSFLYELRGSGKYTDMFSKPDWPERALELRNQKFGPIPGQFR